MPVPPLDPGLAGESELNAPLNPTGPLHNSTPPMNYQPPRAASQAASGLLPTSARAPPAPGPGSIGNPFDMTRCLAEPPPSAPPPVSKGDSSFDMTTCLEALPDLDSGPGSLTLKELWYNRTAVHEGWHTLPAPAPGPGPMGDLSPFDMTDMFASGPGDFDFGPGSLSDMDLWFDPVDVHDSLSAPAPPAPGPRSRRDHQSHLTAMFGRTGGVSDFCPGSPTDTERWLGPTAVHNGSPAPPVPGPKPMRDLSFDMTDMFSSTPVDFDFGTGSLSDMELWFDPSAVHDGSMMHDGSIDMK